MKQLMSCAAKQSQCDMTHQNIDPDVQQHHGDTTAAEKQTNFKMMANVFKLTNFKVCFTFSFFVCVFF